MILKEIIGKEKFYEAKSDHLGASGIFSDIFALGGVCAARICDKGKSGGALSVQAYEVV